MIPVYSLLSAHMSTHTLPYLKENLILKSVRLFLPPGWHLPHLSQSPGRENHPLHDGFPTTPSSFCHNLSICISKQISQFAFPNSSAPWFNVMPLIFTYTLSVQRNTKPHNFPTKMHRSFIKWSCSPYRLYLHHSNCNCLTFKRWFQGLKEGFSYICLISVLNIIESDFPFQAWQKLFDTQAYRVTFGGIKISSSFCGC